MLFKGRFSFEHGKCAQMNTQTYKKCTHFETRYVQQRTDIRTNVTFGLAENKV